MECPTGFNLAWSDDARYLAYEVLRCGEGKQALAVYDVLAAGTRRTLGARAGGRLQRIFAWQPDGIHIALTMNRSGGAASALFVVSATDDGPNRTAIAIDRVPTCPYWIFVAHRRVTA